MHKWHLIYTKPQKERLVEHQLTERGLETFLPFELVDRGYGRGVRRVPYFPNYLFVHVDLYSASARDLGWMPGVRSLVYFDAKPAVVPDRLMDSLRERLEPYQETVVKKDEWTYKSGQKVMVNSGLFAGYEAIFQTGLNGQKRVRILLDVLGAQTRADVDVEQLILVTESLVH